jgi:hypothetical protein
VILSIDFHSDHMQVSIWTCASYSCILGDWRLSSEGEGTRVHTCCRACAGGRQSKVLLFLDSLLVARKDLVGHTSLHFMLRSVVRQTHMKLALVSASVRADLQQLLMLVLNFMSVQTKIKFVFLTTDQIR